MRIRIYILLTIMAVGGLISCENDGFYYQDKARVRLVGDDNWTLGTDSLELSFTTHTGNEAQIKVDACIMGNVTDYDRVVNIEVDPEKTTAPKELYDVPSTVVVPANENKGTFNATIRNSDVLQSKYVKLHIKVAASDDFALGVNEETHLIVKWSDIIVKPLFWDDIEEHFGTYSAVKYRFMLDCLMAKGFSTNLDPASGLNWADLHNYNIVFANMLKEYNTAHSGAPLTDENGTLITF